MQKRTSIQTTKELYEKKRQTDAFSVVSPKLYQTLYDGLEKMRDNKGAFLASLSDDYRACWIRDQLYANMAYLYTGETDKFLQGIRVVFDILHQQFDKIEFRVCNPPTTGDEHIHAKYHIENYAEVTPDWGHHQVDAIGLFLYVVADAYERGLPVLGNENSKEENSSGKDRELLQLLVNYLTATRYWEKPDNGMWEEWMELHTSSIGAAVKGLSLVKKHNLAVVPDTLIRLGLEQLFSILPNETPGREQDLAQLSLLWPYQMLPFDLSEVVLHKIKSRLVQSKGLNRYLDDNYYRSANGISAEWTFGFFWLSIIACERGILEEARFWLLRGLSTMTKDGFLPELYQDGMPNKNTPLAWSHALALIAIHKLEARGKSEE